MKEIAEILKDCPIGTKLYSPIFGEVELEKVTYISIIIRDTNKQTHEFYTDGRMYSNGECLLFQSKENRDWSTFQRPFKDGDILFITSVYNWIVIYKDSENKEDIYKYVATSEHPNHKFIVYDNNPLCCKEDVSNIRFATESEKEKLFKAIKDNYYRWNPETKTLEKLGVPKFKVGDRIRHKTHKRQVNVVTDIKDTHYVLDNELALPFTSQDNYELVPNKFDISTLKPFDKVLVRDATTQYWSVNLFGYYLHGYPYPFCCSGNCTTIGFKYCIPYKGNEHLLGTTNDCDECYKTWK